MKKRKKYNFKKVMAKLLIYLKKIVYYFFKYLKIVFKFLKKVFINRFLIILFIIAGFSVFLFYELNGYFDSIHLKSVFNLTNILIPIIPCILTIISISLSMPNEEFYGVKRINLNKLRSNFSFTFLEMLLISIVLFAAYIVLQLFKLKICTLYIDSISVFFCVYFSISEIPLLLKKEHRLLKIGKRAYKNKGKNKNDPNDFYADTYISNMILENGVIKIYEKIK